MRNNIDTTIRSYIIQRRIKRKTELSSSFGSLLMYASVIETMFYLPNRFRHTVMLNTHNIAFVNSESTLLSLMSVMFNLQHQPDIMEFKLKQFATCYRLFFACTLPYEALSVTSRIKLHEAASLKYPQVNSYA